MGVPERNKFVLPCGPSPIELGARTVIMGIVNVTPDSFSDGGIFYSTDAAVKHALGMVDAGADIVDVGGESTRPGSEPVSEEEELRRVIPVIKEIRSASRVTISVDTCKPKVAEKAIEAGADIVNDITGFQGDLRLARVVALNRVPAVLMHIRGTPRTMQHNTEYRNLFGEILDYLLRSIELAVQAGCSEDSLVIDPGIGFGKAYRHNLEILQRLPELASLGRPILVGPSRKSFIGLTLGLPPGERLFGTVAAAAIAAWNGAHILRVHDVEPVRQVLDMVDAIRCPPEVPPRG